MGRAAGRGKVINVGDALNRAILTNEEIDSGIRRLQLAGWATHRDGLYEITPKGKRFVHMHGGLTIKGSISLMLHLMKVVEGMEVSGEVDESDDIPVQHPFESSDSWLLMTLNDLEAAATVDAVIEAGHKNGAHFTSEQISGGMERLGAAGLAEKIDDKLSITEKGRQLVKRHQRDDRNWILTLMHVSEELMDQNG